MKRLNSVPECLLSDRDGAPVLQLLCTTLYVQTHIVWSCVCFLLSPEKSDLYVPFLSVCDSMPRPACRCLLVTCKYNSCSQDALLYGRKMYTSKYGHTHPTHTQLCVLSSHFVINRTVEEALILPIHFVCVAVCVGNKSGGTLMWVSCLSRGRWGFMWDRICFCLSLL